MWLSSAVNRAGADTATEIKKKKGKFSAVDGGVQGRNTVNLRENELPYTSRPLEAGDAKW